MKRTVISISLCVLFLSASAQFKVMSNGRVAINGSGSSSYQMSCSNTSSGRSGLLFSANGNNSTSAIYGGKLIINGGTLSNVNLVLKPGATLRIINGGIMDSRNAFEAPNGAIVDLQYGQIL